MTKMHKNIEKQTENNEAFNENEDIKAKMNDESTKIDKEVIIEEQKKVILDLDKKIKELNDTILRQYADTDNLRKRYQREIEDANKYAVTEFARDLIEIFENIYRAKDYINIEQEKDIRILNMLEGLDMTIKLFEGVWQKYGMSRIHPEGEMFDHDFHQAISHTSCLDKPNNSVINVVQSGYKIKERLLRPALVIVAKND